MSSLILRHGHRARLQHLQRDCVNPALLESVRTRVSSAKGRLVLPITTMSEIADGNPEAAAVRLGVVADLAQSMGPRFIISQDVGDHLRREWTKAIKSVLKIPPGDAQGLLETCRAKDDLLRKLPLVKTAIRRQLRRDEDLRRDRTLRDELAAKFAHLRSRLDEMLDCMTDDWFWNLVFVDNVSKRGKYRNHIRSHPGRYATAALVAGFDTLTVLGVLFGAKYSGRHKGILHGPRKNEWVDSRVAGCVAHARVFLSEDELQRNKINHVAAQFGLRITARSMTEWLGTPTDGAPTQTEAAA